MARLGGDEFTVVLENLVGMDDADRSAREIIMAFEAPLPRRFAGNLDLAVDRHQPVPGPRAGADRPAQARRHRDVPGQAAGRRTFVRYDEQMDEAVRRRATIASALRKVLDRDELLRVVTSRACRCAPHRRGRGAAALDQRRARRDPADHVHPAGRGNRDDPWKSANGSLREACLALQRWRQHGGLRASAWR